MFFHEPTEVNPELIPIDSQESICAYEYEMPIMDIDDILPVNWDPWVSYNIYYPKQNPHILELNQELKANQNKLLKPPSLFFSIPASIGFLSLSYKMFRDSTRSIRCIFKSKADCCTIIRKSADGTLIFGLAVASLAMSGLFLVSIFHEAIYLVNIDPNKVADCKNAIKDIQEKIKKLEGS